MDYNIHYIKIDIIFFIEKIQHKKMRLEEDLKEGIFIGHVRPTDPIFLENLENI